MNRNLPKIQAQSQFHHLSSLMTLSVTWPCYQPWYHKHSLTRVLPGRGLKTYKRCEKDKCKEARETTRHLANGSIRHLPPPLASRVAAGPFSSDPPPDHNRTANSMCPFASATSAGALPRRALNRCHVGLPAIVGLHVGSGALTHQKLRDGEVTIQSREMKSYATSKLSMPCVLRSNLAESPAFFVSLGFVEAQRILHCKLQAPRAPRHLWSLSPRLHYGLRGALRWSHSPSLPPGAELFCLSSSSSTPQEALKFPV